MRQLLIVFLSVFVLYSCNKDEALTETTENVTQAIEKDGKEELTLPTVRDGRLVFECEEKMEEFIQALAENEVAPASIDKEYGYQSFLNYVTPTTTNEAIFGDEYFAAVLNKDGAVEIGNYVFKLNPVTQQVFALQNTASKGELDGMIAATSDAQLSSKGLVFSFDDDVFDLLDGDASCERWWGCGEDCVRRNVNRRDVTYCENNNGLQGAFYIHVKYENLGIWHWVNTRVEQGCNNLNVQLRLDYRYIARWRRRCRITSTKTRDYVCNFVPTTQTQLNGCLPLTGFVEQKYKVRFYHGTRCLSGYDLRTDARIRNVCTGELLWTDFAEMEAGVL